MYIKYKECHLVMEMDLYLFDWLDSCAIITNGQFKSQAQNQNKNVSRYKRHNILEIDATQFFLTSTLTKCQTKFCKYLDLLGGLDSCIFPKI